MRPISKEKREMLTAAKLRGEKESTIALWLGVSVRSVAGIWKLYKTRGDVSPIKYRGRPSRMTEADTEAIRQAVKQTPDITLNELIEDLSLPIKKSQLSRLLTRLGLVFKKKRSTRRTD